MPLILCAKRPPRIIRLWLVFAVTNAVNCKKGVVALGAFTFLALCPPASAAEILCLIAPEGASPEKEKAAMDLLIKKPQLQAMAHLFNVTQGSDTGQVSHLGSIRKGPLFSTSKQYILKVRSGSVTTETFMIDRVTGRYSSTTAATTGPTFGTKPVEYGGTCRVIPAAKVVF